MLVVTVNKISFLGDFFRVTAALMAVEHGHGEFAKWLFRQLGLIQWECSTGNVLFSATKAQNLDMLAFLSHQVPGLSIRNLPPNVTIALWKFLKDKEQVLNRKLAPKYPEGFALFSC